MCWVKGNQVSPVYSVNFNLFLNPHWVMIASLQRCTYGHTSQYHSIQLTNVASVYIVFPCHARECGNCISNGHLFLHFSSNRTVMLFHIFSRRMCWHSVPVVSGYITFNMLSTSTQQMSSFCGQWKDGDGGLGHMNLTRQLLLSSLVSITTLMHHVPSYVQGI
jgi:hypothetical protein